jgi:hypothetical protein
MFNEDASSPQIKNSIIWGNTTWPGDGIFNNDVGISVPVIKSSIVQGSTGVGSSWNLTGTVRGDDRNLADPGTDSSDSPFVGWTTPPVAPTTAGDYRLEDSKPGIDAGDNSYYPANADVIIESLLPVGATLSAEGKAAINEVLGKDLDGANRTQGTAIDMGAYEKQ